MPIPLATTTITVKGKRPQEATDPDAEGYDATPPIADDVIATGVRACITLPSGIRNSTDSDEVVIYLFRCDPIDVDVTRFDTVTDESTGVEYQVGTAQHSLIEDYGLKHITGRLYLTRGLGSEGGGYVVPA